jgi:hypothetical protein
MVVSGVCQVVILIQLEPKVDKVGLGVERVVLVTQILSVLIMVLVVKDINPHNQAILEHMDLETQAEMLVLHILVHLALVAAAALVLLVALQW